MGEAAAQERKGNLKVSKNFKLFGLIGLDFFGPVGPFVMNYKFLVYSAGMGSGTAGVLKLETKISFRAMLHEG